MFKIMIVEDDPKLKEIVIENIRKWGFETWTVTDFSAVLKDFIKFEPHLLLMDINLPALMVSTGVRRSVAYQEYPLYLYLPGAVIWI